MSRSSSSPHCVWRRWDRCARKPPTSGPRHSGSRARRSISNTVRNATARRGTAKDTAATHLRPRPRNFTTGMFKVRTTSKRSAPDTSGPRQHHQARHALHLDARLARPLRPGRVESGVLHQDLLPRVLQPRRVPLSPFRSRARREPRRSQSRLGRSSTKRPAA